MEKKTKVLFIGGTRRSNPLNPTSSKKIKALSHGFEMAFIGFHKEKGAICFKENADFYLLSSKMINYIRHLYFLIYAFLKGTLLVRNKDIPVIVCQSPFEGIAGAFIKIFRPRIKLIIEIHGEWDKAPVAYKRINRKFKWATDLIGKWALKKSDAIRVISKATQKTVSNFKKPIFSFPTYTDIELFLNADKYEVVSNRFIFVGQIIHLKGVDTLINMVKTIKEMGIKIEVLIVGDGEEKRTFINQVKDLKLDKEIKFLGPKSQVEIAKLIKSSIALILPSTTEGLGRVILEAFACSRPAIGSCVGGIPELIIDGETGLLIQPADSESLAEKILFALDNREKMENMGLNGRRFVEQNLSTKKFAENYFQMIEEIIKT